MLHVVILVLSIKTRIPGLYYKVHIIFVMDSIFPFCEANEQDRFIYTKYVKEPIFGFVF